MHRILTMTASLNELCKLMYKCAEKIEEEFKTTINKYHNDVVSNDVIERDLAFDKNHDFHYKEIIKILGDIMINVKKIMYHEDFIRKLKKNGKYEAISEEQGTPPFLTLTRSGTPGVIKRERRRIVSEVSMQSLDAWESFLKSKDEEDEILQAEKNKAKKIHHRYKKRSKKMVSSTFNNILEDNANSIRNSLIIEENEPIEEKNNELVDEKKCYSAEYPDIGCSISASMFDLLSSLPNNRTKFYSDSEEEKEENIEEEEDMEREREGSCNEEEVVRPTDKPRIVDCVYKTNPN